MLRALRVCGAVPSLRGSAHLWLLVTATLVAFAAMSPPHPAVAQDVGIWFSFPPPSGRSYMRPRRHALPPKAPHRAHEEVGAEQKQKHTGPDKEHAATGPLFAVLSLSDQHISVYSATGLVTRSKVSTGMPGHRTPMGIFSIIGRERWHRSNIYSGAPMPYMQRITWSGVALHLGVVPGYPASHGCIRLPAGSAERLWGLTKIGERVVISPHEITPKEIAHALLPVPRMRPSPALSTESPPAKVTEVATTAAGPFPDAASKLLNPIEYAQALKARAAADVVAATRAVKELSERTVVRSEPIRKALADLQAAETARAHAEARLAAKSNAVERARTPLAKKSAEAAMAAAQAQLAESTSRFEAAKASEALQTPEAREALEAERALKEARAALAKAQATAKEAERRVSPVSILVSRKDNRVYIRQGLAPVLDAPASIRDPEMPLGTHVYIASSVGPDGSSLGWSVVSLPASPASAEASHPQRRHDSRGQNPAPPSERPLTASDAASALERIDIPKEVSERISELLWTGGSLIVSDQPLSDETSDIGTDIVVTLR